MGSGAYVTAGGVWTNASSRAFKENIQDLTTEEAILALEALQPKKFNYKAGDTEQYLGFIAEETPELVSTADRKGLSAMDIVAVVTKVVQQQREALQAIQAENVELRATLTALSSRLNDVEHRFGVQQAAFTP
jgi:hypothetical protein